MNKKNNLKVLKFPSKLNEIEKKVEAILFSAAEPLDLEAIKDKIQTRTDLKKILASLQQHYNDRGINLVCISNKWSFRTTSKLTHFMKLQAPTQKKLSKATIETLAIIVYHQPVTRSEIEEIRGVAYATGTLEI